jgi:hypothetical protein
MYNSRFGRSYFLLILDKPYLHRSLRSRGLKGGYIISHSLMSSYGGLLGQSPLTRDAIVKARSIIRIESFIASGLHRAAHSHGPAVEHSDRRPSRPPYTKRNKHAANDMATGCHSNGGPLQVALLESSTAATK